MPFLELSFCLVILTIPVFSQSDVTPITSSEEAGVQDIVVPMCKNFLPYTKTKLPNRFGHSTQVEVYR